MQLAHELVNLIDPGTTIERFLIETAKVLQERLPLRPVVFATAQSLILETGRIPSPGLTLPEADPAGRISGTDPRLPAELMEAANGQLLRSLAIEGDPAIGDLPHRLLAAGPEIGPQASDLDTLLPDIAGLVGRLSHLIFHIRFREAEAHTQAELMQMYKSVFETTGTGTIIIEEDLTITYANNLFQQMTGFSGKEIEGLLKWSNFVVPEDRERMQQYHYRRRQPGGNLIPTQYECRIADKTGRRKEIFMTVGMIPGSTRSIASFLDITVRKNAEDALRQRESQLNAIIENFDGFLFTYHQDMRIGFMNRALIDRTGMDGTGTLCEDSLKGLEALFTFQIQERVFSGETLRMEVECTTNGRWYYTIHSPIFGSDGTVSRVQVMMIDISERKRAETALKKREADLRNENWVLRTGLRDRYKFGNIVGKSAAMQAVYDLILKAAASTANVIIAGESGTGKELVAHAIHQMSPRRDQAFVVVNCGAIPEHLLESEFFGYKKGAFTGAVTDKKGYLDLADGGTLFLDEVGELSIGLQVKLLRVIEGGGYAPVGSSQPKRSNVRIIAASNRDLREHVRRNLMREDFFYRIHIIPIPLPPLRERREDIPLLMDHFIDQFDHPGDLPPLSGAVMEAFTAYDWPGNVRELQNTLYRYITLKKIDFPTIHTPKVTQETPLPEGMSLKEAVDHFEKELLKKTLDQHQWHRTKTAEALGIHRKTLFTKLRQYGLQ